MLDFLFDLIFGWKFIIASFCLVFIGIMIAAGVKAMVNDFGPNSKKQSSGASAVKNADEIDPETIAAITSAAYVSLGKKVQVKRIRYHSAKKPTFWSKHGRMAVMASRIVRR